MPNKGYKKGYELERMVVNAFRKAGYHAVRSAGSHSNRDVFVWREPGDTAPLKWAPIVLDELKFKRVFGAKIYIRTGKKYIDKLYFYQFTSAKAEEESMIMFQCKRLTI